MIKDYDLKYVNQESIIGGSQFKVSGYPTFNAPDAIGDNLVDMGFTTLTSIFTGIGDLINGTDNTRKMWEATKARVAENRTKSIFDSLYQNSPILKRMYDNSLIDGAKVRQVGNGLPTQLHAYACMHMPVGKTHRHTHTHTHTRAPSYALACLPRCCLGPWAFPVSTVDPSWRPH